MGRIPCCEKDNVKRGQWTPEEDQKLSSYIAQHGTRNWRLIPKHAGLQRCGKSCRLRWTNYLRPDLKHGQFSENEEQTIMTLHSVLGNRWSVIASQLPGRTDNDVKNHWNTKLRKKLSGMGIDPVTHKPFSHLITEIATLPPNQSPNLAEAALGCFKDEMLHLLTKRRLDFQSQQFNANTSNNMIKNDEDAVDKIRFGISKAVKEPEMLQISNRAWGGTDMTGFNGFVGSESGYGYGLNEVDGVSTWDHQSVCSGSSRGDHQQNNNMNIIDENGGKEEACNVFNSECSIWDLPTEDLIN